MGIVEIVNEMTAYLKESGQNIYPCTEKEISDAESQFGFVFPDTYKRILRHSNGVSHNGLVIWPATSGPLFQETIYQANDNLREDFSNAFLYFAQNDEELYVLKIEKQEYCAMEYVGKAIWKQFSGPDEMFQFLLQRAWE